MAPLDAEYPAQQVRPPKVLGPAHGLAGGIDREGIRRALQASGQPADGGALDDEALVNAVFEAGFSTRAQSDALSGHLEGGAMAPARAPPFYRRSVTRLAPSRQTKLFPDA